MAKYPNELPMINAPKKTVHAPPGDLPRVNRDKKPKLEPNAMGGAPNAAPEVKEEEAQEAQGETATGEPVTWSQVLAEKAEKEQKAKEVLGGKEAPYVVASDVQVACKVKLSKEEIALRSQQVMKALADLGLLKDEAKEAAAEYKLKIKEKEAFLAVNADIARSGTDMRLVNCIKLIDFNENVIKVIRQDEKNEDGSDIVEEVTPLTDDARSEAKRKIARDRRQTNMWDQTGAPMAGLPQTSERSRK